MMYFTRLLFIRKISVSSDKRGIGARGGVKWVHGLQVAVVGGLSVFLQH